MQVELSLNVAMVSTGALLLIVAFFGRAKGFSVEIPATSSLAVRWLVGLVGASLVATSVVSFWIHYFGPVRIDAIEARWDATSANACGGTAGYTIQLTTSGSGQRSFGYTIHVDGSEWAGSVDVGTPGTVYDRKMTTFHYRYRDLPKDVNLEVDLGGEKHAISKDPLHLTCDESSDTLIQKTQAFFDSYRDQVLASGRSGPAVTHYYYQYPLDWYGQVFPTEADLLQHVRSGTSTASSSAPAKCAFSNGRVTRVLSNGDPIRVETVVSWNNLQDGRRGQVLATYDLARTSESLGYRIKAVHEASGSEQC